MTDAELVESNIDLSATYRLYMDSLEDDLYINAFVKPMGSAPTFRLIFNLKNIIEIPEDPEGLAEGVYTVDADAMHETNENDHSMADQFLTEPVQLAVENGQIIANMVWHGTDSIPMSWIEGLWYEKSAGDYIELTNTSAVVLDESQNTLTITLPVENLTEPTIMQVYVPNGMGDSKPRFRLVFNPQTLVEAGEPNPN